MEIRTQITTLNNKSRQGQYIRVSSKKQPTRYYKYHQQPQEIQEAIQKYQKNFTQPKPPKKETKKTIKPKKTTKKTIKQPKTTKISTAFKKGISTVNIHNCLKTSDNQVKKHTMQLLSKLIHDKTLLEIMSQEENMKKIAFRMEYKITFLGKEDQILATANTFNTTPTQLVKLLKKEYYENQEWNLSTPNKIEKLNIQYTTQQKNQTLQSIRVTMLLRKG